MTLEAAVAAARKQDFAAARDALVVAWRARRSPVLAELVALIDPRAPDAVSEQIAAIVTPRAASSLANLKQLAKLDDPRLAGWAIDALVHLPFTAAGGDTFLHAVVATAARHRDPRLSAQAPAIKAAVTTRIGRLATRNKLVRGVERAIAACPAVVAATASESEHERALAQIVEPMRGSARSAEALLAAIYANPDDDAARLVYADLLSDLGDPRGEFIALQIARGDRVPTARELELQKLHGKAWLGELAPVLSWGKGYARTTFRRGFLSNADIILSVGKKLRPILTHPAWSTVESFGRMYRDDDHLLEHAPLRALKELAVNAELVAHLAARKDKLTSLTRVQLGYPPCTREALHEALPNLVTVGAHWQAPSRAEIVKWAAFGAPHLEMFHGGEFRTAATHDKLRAFAESLVGTPAEVERLTLHFSPHHSADEGTPIELVRDKAGNYSHRRKK